MNAVNETNIALFIIFSIYPVVIILGLLIKHIPDLIFWIRNKK